MDRRTVLLAAAWEEGGPVVPVRIAELIWTDAELDQLGAEDQTGRGLQDMALARRSPPAGVDRWHVLQWRTESRHERRAAG